MVPEQVVGHTLRELVGERLGNPVVIQLFPEPVLQPRLILSHVVRGHILNADDIGVRYAVYDPVEGSRLLIEHTKLVSGLQMTIYGVIVRLVLSFPAGHIHAFLGDLLAVLVDGAIVIGLLDGQVGYLTVKGDARLHVLDSRVRELLTALVVRLDGLILPRQLPAALGEPEEPAAVEAADKTADKGAYTDLLHSLGRTVRVSEPLVQRVEERLVLLKGVRVVPRLYPVIGRLARHALQALLEESLHEGTLAYVIDDVRHGVELAPLFPGQSPVRVTHKPPSEHVPLYVLIETEVYVEHLTEQGDIGQRQDGYVRDEHAIGRRRVIRPELGELLVRRPPPVEVLETPYIVILRLHEHGAGLHGSLPRGRGGEERTDVHRLANGASPSGSAHILANGPLGGISGAAHRAHQPISYASYPRGLTRDPTDLSHTAQESSGPRGGTGDVHDTRPGEHGRG